MITSYRLVKILYAFVCLFAKHTSDTIQYIIYNYISANYAIIYVALHKFIREFSECICWFNVILIINVPTVFALIFQYVWNQ